ncbi:pinensin family lanthipeptide [Pedobacter sp. KBW06]|uniref:pinensin family lanthipeptide n=1 Tax=Pedobacter sp. KBW06 TaxID=2153359 RepID=UPI000F5939B5|nr:pinensin family lanthipeptide [Pedobacter sp. KBW06]
MKKLKIEDLKVQSFVTSFSNPQDTEQFVGGAETGTAVTCTVMDGQCTMAGYCTLGNCGTTPCSVPTNANCMAFSQPEHECSNVFCGSVNASCANGANCWIDPLYPLPI